MSRLIDEMIEETKKATERATRIEMAIQMLADKLPVEMIAKYSKLSLEEVTALASALPQ